jgi:hypothetical protein
VQAIFQILRRFVTPATRCFPAFGTHARKEYPEGALFFQGLDLSNGFSESEAAKSAGGCTQQGVDAAFTGCPCLPFISAYRVYPRSMVYTRFANLRILFTHGRFYFFSLR